MYTKDQYDGAILERNMALEEVAELKDKLFKSREIRYELVDEIAELKERLSERTSL